MIRRTSSAPDPAPHPARLRQFLDWIVFSALVFALVEAVAFAFFRDVPSGATSLIMLAYGAALLVLRPQIRQGRLKPVVGAICAGLFLANVTIVLLQPALFFAFALGPLVVVAVALPFLTGPQLRRLIVVCWIVAVIFVLLGELTPPLPGPPHWFSIAFRISSLAACFALVLLLLWQFSSRLTDTLAATRAAEERYALATRGANDGIWDWDVRTNQIYYSPRWKTMLGWPEETIGTAPDEWFRRVHPDDRARVKAELSLHQDGLTPHFECEYRMQDASGRYLWMLSRGLAVRDEHGRATRMAGSQTDITRRKQIEEQLHHEAFHDALTRLPNRALFMSRLGRSVEYAQRHAEYQFAVLFLDLDRFKLVNDSLGHRVGDDLLVALARRLEACLRPGDMVARLGGDEFTLLLDRINDVADATRVAERIHEALMMPFHLDGVEFVTSVSIGIALSATRYDRPEDVLRDADIALYRAKALGKSRHEVFDTSMHTRAVALLQLETDLRRAIEHEEFVLHYQPLIAVASNRIMGVEAFVRWQHPQRGLLLPAEFMSVAEETGMIVPLGWLVLRVACTQLRRWHTQFPDQPLTLSVNITGSQLIHPDFFEELGAILTQTGLPGRYLRLEINERVLVEHADAAARILAQLRELELQLHVDDFGTGYSSLSALHRFPVDALKIDRSFMQQLAEGGEQTEIVRTIVALAHNLDIAVIGEGVETALQLEYLQTLGCDFVQGACVARPLDASALADFVASYPQHVSGSAQRTARSIARP